jgi:hypothetical protein
MGPREGLEPRARAALSQTKDVEEDYARILKEAVKQAIIKRNAALLNARP